MQPSSVHKDMYVERVVVFANMLSVCTSIFCARARRGAEGAYEEVSCVNGEVFGFCLLVNLNIWSLFYVGRSRAKCQGTC